MYAQKDGVKTADRLVKAGIPAIVVLPETFDSLKSTLRLMARGGGRARAG
jgi:iron complex transport system substrate-binding protein